MIRIQKYITWGIIRITNEILGVKGLTAATRVEPVPSEMLVGENAKRSRKHEIKLPKIFQETSCELIYHVTYVCSIDFCKILRVLPGVKAGIHSTM